MIVVLGSSPNDLVAACYLAKAGRPVTVVVRAAVVDDDGWIAPAIAKDLGLNVETRWTDRVVALQKDGAPFVLWNDVARAQEEIAKRSPDDAKKWSAFSTRIARLAGFLETLYVDEPPRILSEDVSDLFALMATGLRLRRLGKIDMVELLRTLPMSVQDLLDDTFDDELLKATIAAGGVSNILQGVRSAGTSFVMLHHLVGRPAGALRTRARPRGLHTALLEAAKTLGVEVKVGGVAGVAVREGRVAGVRLATGDEVAATHVLSGADPKTTFLDWVDPTELPPEFVRAVMNVKLRGARAVCEVEVVEKPDALSEGALLSIAPTLDYVERAYDHAKHGRLSENFVLEGCLEGTTLSLAVQYVPYAVRDTATLGDRVLATLAEFGVKARDARVQTPRDLEAKFGLREGHLYGGEPTLDQLLFMRPLPGWAHYATPIEGLFLCGASCHPGGALPGLAGAHAARSVLKGR